MIELIARAIRRSISHNEIVRLVYDQDLARELFEACEGERYRDGVHEFWGRSPLPECCDGDEEPEPWRIHLTVT